MPLSVQERSSLTTLSTMKAGCDLGVDVASSLFTPPGGANFARTLSEAITLGMQGIRTSNALLANASAVKDYLVAVDQLLFQLIENGVQITHNDFDRMQWMGHLLADLSETRQEPAVRDLVGWARGINQDAEAAVAQEAPEAEAQDEPNEVPAAAPRFPGATPPRNDDMVNVNRPGMAEVNIPAVEHWHNPAPVQPVGQEVFQDPRVGRQAGVWHVNMPGHL